MRAATLQFAQMLAGAQSLFKADLFTLILRSGTVLRYTDADVPIHWLGHDYSHQGPLFERDGVRQRLGLEVDSLSITITVKDDDLLLGQPWAQAVRGGVLDGARFRLEKYLGPSHNHPDAGALHLFEGRVSRADPTRYQTRLEVKSDKELLDIKLPRAVYQPGCRLRLYSAACGVDREALGLALTVASGSTLTRLECSGLAAQLALDATYFDLGSLVFDSGQLQGFTATVRRADNDGLDLITPLPFLPQVGDGFTAYPGCNGKLATCRDKFSNVVHFQGEPFVPVPEKVM